MADARVAEAVDAVVAAVAVEAHKKIKSMIYTFVDRLHYYNDVCNRFC